MVFKMGIIRNIYDAVEHRILLQFEISGNQPDLWNFQNIPVFPVEENAIKESSGI